MVSAKAKLSFEVVVLRVVPVPSVFSLYGFVVLVIEETIQLLDGLENEKKLKMKLACTSLGYRGSEDVEQFVNYQPREIFLALHF
jgi:hypothetical protein